MPPCPTHYLSRNWLPNKRRFTSSRVKATPKRWRNVGILNNNTPWLQKPLPPTNTPQGSQDILTRKRTLERKMVGPKMETAAGGQSQISQAKRRGSPEHAKLLMLMSAQRICILHRDSFPQTTPKPTQPRLFASRALSVNALCRG